MNAIPFVISRLDNSSTPNPVAVNIAARFRIGLIRVGKFERSLVPRKTPKIWADNDGRSGLADEQKRTAAAIRDLTSFVRYKFRRKVYARGR